MASYLYKYHYNTDLDEFFTTINSELTTLLFLHNSTNTGCVDLDELFTTIEL